MKDPVIGTCKFCHALIYVHNGCMNRPDICQPCHLDDLADFAGITKDEAAQDKELSSYGPDRFDADPELYNRMDRYDSD